jgi:hypothetical protein
MHFTMSNTVFFYSNITILLLLNSLFLEFSILPDCSFYFGDLLVLKDYLHLSFLHTLYLVLVVYTENVFTAQNKIIYAYIEFIIINIIINI